MNDPRLADGGSAKKSELAKRYGQRPEKLANNKSS